MVVSLTRRVALAVAATAVLFATALALLLTAVDNLQERADAGRQTLPVIRLIDELEGVVLNTDEALEEYVIEGRRGRLRAVDAARARIPAIVAQLRDAPSSSLQQGRLVEELREDALSYLGDHALPLARLAEVDGARARSELAKRDRARSVAAIRSRADQLASSIRAGVSELADRAEERANLARTLTWVAGLLSTLILVGLVLFLARSVARPLRSAASAATALGAGDLSVRLPHTERRDELGLLTRAFNTMGEALQTRTTELQDATTSLRVSTENQGQFAAMGEDLARARDLDERAAVLIRRLADHLGCEAAAIYSRRRLDDEPPVPVALRGLDAAQMPAQLTAAEGLPGRALHERRTLCAEHLEGDLEVETYGHRTSIRHELHTPIVHGDEPIGVISLARTADRPFTEDDIRIAERQANQGAVAFANSIEASLRAELADLQRAVLDATAEGIFLVDPEGRTLISNPAMQRMLRDVYDLDPDAGDFAELAAHVIQRAADPELVAAYYEEIRSDPLLVRSFEYGLQNGRWVHSYLAPVHASDGELLGRVVVLREITEQRQAERVKDELMATVSHELRTPLSAILGFTELLQARDYPPEERQEYIDTVHDQAVRLSRLINDFLDLQRLQHRDAGIDKRPVEICKLIADEVAVHDGHSPRHRVTATLPARDVTIRADSERLRRALGNLLSNAIKYSPEGGNVTVDLETTDEDVVISVHDEGIGIPPEVRPQMFQRFFRVDNSDTQRIGGTGLGLALVREVAEAHGGAAGYDSIVGRGSRFWIRIPLS